MGVLRRSAGPLGVAEPDPVLVVLGGDLGEQHHDLGHRLLPPGQYLGVTDRLVEREHHRGQPEMTDAIAHAVIIQVINLYDDYTLTASE